MADGVSVKLEPPISFIRAQAGAFRRDLSNLIPLWDRFERELSAIGQERFDTRGYGEWPALAASTLAQKAAHGFPLDPLIRTRTLEESLTNPALAAVKGPQQFSWGTDVEYAHFHQDGGDTPGRPPQRKVLDLRVEDRRRLEREQVSWLNERARLTWGRI